MNLFSKKTVRIPPPIVTGVFCALMYGLSLLLEVGLVSKYKTGLVFILTFCALLLLLPAVIQFYQHQTTVNPLQPEKANKLVVSGLYRFSRNPMYLGMACLLSAWGVYLGNPFNIILFIAYIAWMNHFQIRLEEDALETLFGDDFRLYKQKVRRWI